MPISSGGALGSPSGEGEFEGCESICDGSRSYYCCVPMLYKCAVVVGAPGAERHK